MANLASFDDVDVVAVADIDVDRATELAAICGARPYGDYLELLERERVEALYVCVPPFAHGDIERAAIELGLPLFIEKPIARDLATAEQIAELIERLNLVTATGYHWRYLDTVEEAHALLAVRPACLALGYWLDVVPPCPWWVQTNKSGGQLVEQTTHIFDLARILVGEISTVGAQASHVKPSDRPDCDVLSVSTVAVKFASGALGTIASTCLLARPHRIGLHLFGDGLIVELSETQLTVDTGKGPCLREATVDPFVREDRDFIDAVHGRPNRIRVPYGEALRAHRLAIAATRAAQEDVAVEIGALPHE